MVPIYLTSPNNDLKQQKQELLLPNKHLTGLVAINAFYLNICILFLNSFILSNSSFTINGKDLSYTT
jgi:hypothetical protein